MSIRVAAVLLSLYPCAVQIQGKRIVSRKAIELPDGDEVDVFHTTNHTTNHTMNHTNNSSLGEVGTTTDFSNSTSTSSGETMHCNDCPWGFRNCQECDKKFRTSIRHLCECAPGPPTGVFVYGFIGHYQYPGNIMGNCLDINICPPIDGKTARPCKLKRWFDCGSGCEVRRQGKDAPLDFMCKKTCDSIEGNDKDLKPSQATASPQGLLRTNKHNGYIENWRDCRTKKYSSFSIPDVFSKEDVAGLSTHFYEDDWMSFENSGRAKICSCRQRTLPPKKTRVCKIQCDSDEQTDRFVVGTKKNQMFPPSKYSKDDFADTLPEWAK